LEDLAVETEPSGEDGRFARPYAFGAGSNSIEIRDPDCRQRKRLQFYEANPGSFGAGGYHFDESTRSRPVTRP
jgi:uncharacterized protein YfaP (DUF2135 family)